MRSTAIPDRHGWAPQRMSLCPKVVTGTRLILVREMKENCPRKERKGTERERLRGCYREEHQVGTTSRAAFMAE